MGNIGGLIRGRAECQLCYGNQIERLLCNTIVGISLRFQLPLLRHHALEDVLCESSARRDAAEVGHVNSDGGIRI